MFAIQCPYCQHQNTPGARFCGDCGAPLHLRPCPACGKVDDVTAKVCIDCGTPFPPLALAEYNPKANPAAASTATPAAAENTAKAPATSPWPLILVAVVAGGLPLIWLNRAHLPLPKAWQTGGPNAAGSAAAPAMKPSVAPAPTPKAATTPPPPPAAPAEPVAAAAEPAPVPAKKAATKPPPKRPPANQRQPSRQAKPVAEADKQTEAARPCTEGIAALGLCDPKQGQK